MYYNNPNMPYYGAGVYPQAPYPYQPLVQTGYQFVQERNALDDSEINTLKNARPSGMLNLNIDHDDVLRAMCTHRDINGVDVVQQLTDGRLFCPICGATWDATPATKEEVKATIDKILDYFQNAKYIGQIPANVVREYFTMIPLLQKFGDLFEYGMKNFEKLLQQRGFLNAADSGIFNQYNGLFGAGMGMPQYGVPNYGGYGMSQYGMPNYGVQPTYQMPGQPMPGQPVVQQPVNSQPQSQPNVQQPTQQQIVTPQQGMAANPNYNPMAMTGYGPGPVYNPQFANQAAMMTPGYPVAGQPVQQPYVIAPQQPVQPAATQPQVQTPSAGQPTQTQTVNLDL